MMLLISLVLGLVPLFGIAWTVMTGTITTVDGLFTTLILLALSGILFLNAALEARKLKLAGKASAPPAQKAK